MWAAPGYPAWGCRQSRTPIHKGTHSPTRPPFPLALGRCLGAHPRLATRGCIGPGAAGGAAALTGHQLPSLALRGDEGSERAAGRHPKTAPTPHTPACPEASLWDQHSPRREGAAKPPPPGAAQGPCPTPGGPAPGCAGRRPRRPLRWEKGLGLSPGGGRGAAHAWSRLPPRWGPRWQGAGFGEKRRRPVSLRGGVYAPLLPPPAVTSTPRPRRLSLPLPIPLPPRSPSKEAPLLPPQRRAPPLSPGPHTHALPGRGRTARSCSPYFMPFKAPSRSLLSCLRMTHFLPFPPFGPGLRPSSRPWALLPPPGPGAAPARPGRGTRTPATGASSAPCLFSFPP